MEMVYICSPFSKAGQKYIVKANIYCRFAYEKGMLPLAPHLFIPQFLNEENKLERLSGLRMRAQLMRLCSAVWVFGANPTKAMLKEIEYANKSKIKVVRFNADMERI